MTTRADLLALTEDALVSLTNRGLYKRAAKEAAAGTGPIIAEDADAIRGTFPDGVICALPPGGLEAAACTCGASGACRHVVAVVLAYQATASDGAEKFEQWSPSEFTDEELETLLGKRSFATARRRHSTGYLARVHPATATEQVPWVELPNCSVRFLVPHDLAYARSDARDTKEAVALAVWAWRAWDALGSEAGDRHFAVGGADERAAVGSGSGPGSADGMAGAPDLAGDPGGDAVSSSSSSSAAGGGAGADGVASAPGISGLGVGQVGAGSGGGSTTGPGDGAAGARGMAGGLGAGHSGSGSGSGSSVGGGADLGTAVPEALASAVDLAADIFLTGVSNLAAGFTPRLARVRRDLDSASLRWPLLAAEDLADQVAAHADRAARHQQVLVADLLAELVARARVAGAAVGQPKSRVLGTEEAAEVALRRLRLTALGCRVLAVGGDRRALVFLADPAAGVVLTLDGRYEGAATGADLVGRRLAGSTVGVLAGGNVVTETAHRRADRRLRLAVNRVARTTVSQSGGAWGHLPSTLLARDLDALAAEFDRLPPRLVRPRVDAEDVRVVAIAEVEHLWYEPGSQRLSAVVRGTAGGTAHIVSEYRSVVPGALDALAEALQRNPDYVSATVRRGRGGLVLTPIAVVAEGRVVVPDLASGDGSKDLDDGAALTPDRLTAAIENAFELLAEMTHRGARHLPPSFTARLDATADRLDAAGLGRCATDLRGLNRTLGPDPGRAAFDAWADAAIRLITTAELR
ncbi:hypothetical protein ABH935_005184 [Catenulispora sp. GAS73]|uniref:hypothetical protein n=1 Tax=Catenulispora sp. GAS73 TaxID=3156269 RepID=UPI00351440D4